MRRRLLSAKLVSICLLSAVACSYTPPKPGSQRLEDYPFRDSKAGVTVAAKAFVSEEGLKESLSGGADYLENDVLPIQILIRNDSRDEQLVRAAHVGLVWAGGSLRAALTVPETYEAVKSSVAGGAIMLGVIGAAAAASQNENKMKDLTTVALKDANISPSATVVGFVFFPLQKNDKSLKGAKLRVVLQNPTRLTDTSFELTLEGDLPKSRGAVSATP